MNESANQCYRAKVTFRLLFLALRMTGLTEQSIYCFHLNRMNLIF